MAILQARGTPGTIQRWIVSLGAETSPWFRAVCIENSEETTQAPGLFGAPGGGHNLQQSRSNCNLCSSRDCSHAHVSRKKHSAFTVWQTQDNVHAPCMQNAPSACTASNDTSRLQLLSQGKRTCECQHVADTLTGIARSARCGKSTFSDVSTDVALGAAILCTTEPRVFHRVVVV
ncbi:hypothetical protein B0H17DRAFT_1128746 [Mycena rosella]|uniref:Uncharacterized protein n=1 Tax=Mycena rosella TaxID=1033263 RepID=A0AAD7GQM7_MYCRO|nr:hypothetical protein B0H17DRAFT_1128746 [Mycena rosella]